MGRGKSRKTIALISAARRIPLHQRRLTEAIDRAYRRGGADDAELNALLIKKMALVRRVAGVAATTPPQEPDLEGVE